jgi:hypothetical protein
MSVVILPDGSAKLTDDQGHSQVLRFVETSGLAAVQSFVGDGTGAATGTPARFKMSTSGGRLAMDLPGVSPELFIVDSQNRITNG